jgi:hypothetical protein
LRITTTIAGATAAGTTTNGRTSCRARRIGQSSERRAEVVGSNLT